MAGTLTTSTEERDGWLVVSIGGDAGMHSGDQLEMFVTRTIARHAQNVIIELRDLEFIGSLGIGQIVNIARETKRRGGTCVIAHARGEPLEALKRSGIDTFVPFLPTVDAALQ